MDIDNDVVKATAGDSRRTTEWEAKEGGTSVIVSTIKQ